MNKLSELTIFGRLLYDALQLPVFIIHPGRKIESEYIKRALQDNPYFTLIRDQLAGYAYALHATEQPVHLPVPGFNTFL